MAKGAGKKVWSANPWPMVHPELLALRECGKADDWVSGRVNSRGETLVPFAAVSAGVVVTRSNPSVMLLETDNPARSS
jgi:hypothetical protein